MHWKIKDLAKRTLNEVIKSLNDHAEDLGTDHHFYKELQDDITKISELQFLFHVKED